MVLFIEGRQIANEVLYISAMGKDGERVTDMLGTQGVWCMVEASMSALFHLERFIFTRGKTLVCFGQLIFLVLS